MYMVYTLLMNVHNCMYQDLLINRAIDAAKAGSRLYKLPHVSDPSNEIVEVSEIVLWGNSDSTTCQTPEVSTNMYVHVCTWYILKCTDFIHVHIMYIHVCTVYIACCTEF